MLEEYGIEIVDEDLDGEEDDSAYLQRPSSVGARAARFVAAQRRKLVWLKRRENYSNGQLRDETIEEAKLRILEAGELQPEISDELRRAAPTAFQNRFASYIENIVNDPARITESDKAIFISENAAPPIIGAKGASALIPSDVQAKPFTLEEPLLSDIDWDDSEDRIVYWCGL